MEKPMTIKIRYLALLAAFLLPASAFAQSTFTGTFTVTKGWESSNEDSYSDVGVSVTINCSSGDHVKQTTNLSASQDVVFTNTGMSDPSTCTITEDTPAGFTANYYNGDSNSATDCTWDDIGGTFSATCDITNTPDPATVTITKTWAVPQGDRGFDGGYTIKLNCDSRVLAPSDSGEDWNSWDWYSKCSDHCGAGVRSGYGDANQVYEFSLPGPAYEGGCTLEEEAKDSLVEIDMSDCVPKDGSSEQSRRENEVSTWIPVNPGDDISCEIVNTVFFEGIPTLNQYGMAILALLMLGVGFVGFRRFV
jgi:hypothetical protein